MSNDIYRSQFRLPYSIYEQIKTAADNNKRSVNAELVERLAATIDIESTLRQVAGTCPLSEAGNLILELVGENEQAIEDLHQLNLEANAKELSHQLAYTEARLDKLEGRIEYMIDQFKLLQSKLG